MHSACENEEKKQENALKRSVHEEKWLKKAKKGNHATQ